MMTRSAAALVAILFAAGCNTEETPTPDPGAAATPASELGTATGDPQPVDPDTVSFIREGRTLHFGGREWIMTGEPVLRPIVRPVGAADGIALYSTAADQFTTETLFFYLGGGYWQALGPTGSEIHQDPDTMPAQQR